MRVASPFNDYSKDALNLYRVIDPEIWTKLVGRVRGANFGAIYGKTKRWGTAVLRYRKVIHGNLILIFAGYIACSSAE